MGEELEDNEHQEIEIVGRHDPEKFDEDVVSIVVRDGNIRFIVRQIFAKFKNVFRLNIEPNFRIENGLDRIQSGAFGNAENL